MIKDLTIGCMAMMVSVGKDLAEAPASLFAIIAWVRENGEVQSESRLRIRTLPLTMRERFQFANIGPTTNASAALLKAMAKEATLIVGKPFPP